MLTPEYYVDMFQQTKKQITDKVITDTSLNKAAHKFIDAQTVFAKMIITNTQDIAKYVVDAQTNHWFPRKDSK
jgi:hypothetical protein